MQTSFTSTVGVVSLLPTLQLIGVSGWEIIATEQIYNLPTHSYILNYVHTYIHRNYIPGMYAYTLASMLFIRLPCTYVHVWTYDFMVVVYICACVCKYPTFEMNISNGEISIEYHCTYRCTYVHT